MRRDEMRTVFRDLAEDSEVRIAAYLGLMRCPSHREIGLVRAALEQEQVNQGGPRRTGQPRSAWCGVALH